MNVPVIPWSIRYYNFGYADQIIRKAHDGENWLIKRINEVGTRLSKKTETWKKFSVNLLMIQPKAGVVWVRQKVKDAIELFQDIANSFIELNIPDKEIKINYTKREINFRGSELRVTAIETNRKSRGKSSVKVGMRKFNAEYMLLVNEERHEIEEDSIRAILEAIRGYNQLLRVDISNPWSILNSYISYCNDNMKFDIDLLWDNHENYDQFKQTDTEIWHYSSWKNNQYLSQDIIDTLLETEFIDPHRARIVVKGMPGISEGAVYTGYIDKVKVIKQKEAHMLRDNLLLADYWAGIDWGKTNSGTRLQLYGIEHDYRRSIGLKRYSHSNKKSLRFKTHLEMIDDIIHKLKEWAKEYPAIRNGLAVEVDWAAVGIIEKLNEEARLKNLPWVEFVECVKYPIYQRIEVSQICMALHKIAFVEGEGFEELIKEWENAQWDDRTLEKEDPKRIKQNDDDIDTWEYAHARYMYEMIEGYEHLLKHKRVYN